jgi:hypothetical protein
MLDRPARAAPQHPNALLAALPAQVLDAVQPHLTLRELKHGEVIAETHGAIHQIYFPHSGIISLVVETREGALVETAMVGRDGVVGAKPLPAAPAQIEFVRAE